jgi:hypothetical protein
MARQNINAGSAPIVWSAIKEAFDKVNANFTEIYATIGGEFEPVDFTQLNTSLIPAINGQYDLGSASRRWEQLFLTSEGILIGDAAIRSQEGFIRLPAGSRVGNKLINDPADVGFGTVSVLGQDDVVADDITSSLNLQAGSGVDITTDAESDTVTFSNTGVLDVTAGTGITVSGDQNKTITNTGVTTITAGLGVSVDNPTGPVTIINEGIVGLEAGTGIGIGARSNETGRVVITNTAPATGILVFRDIIISGQPILTAQSVADQLSFIQGTGITLTTTLAGGGQPARVTVTNSGVTGLTSAGPGITLDNNTGDIAVSFDNRVDIVGSVFADNSTMLVDGTNGVIPWTVISGSPSLNDVVSVDATTNIPVTLNGGILTPNISTSDSSSITVTPVMQFNSNIVVDGDLVLNGDNRIQANTKITVVPTVSAESAGSILNITGIPAGEGSPGVVVSSPSEFIQIGTWIMFSDGGLFSVPLSAAPDFPFSGKIYIADGVNWDPANYTSGTPYPVFYDGNDFLPMTAAPSP